MLFLPFLLLTSFVLDFVAYEQEVPGVDHPYMMVPVPGGTFEMGSSKHSDTQLHEVSVDDFWMSAHEVSWDQYEVFVYGDVSKGLKSAAELRALGVDGVSGATSPYVEMSFGMGKDGFPAVNVTQYAALMYCKWLTARTGIFYRLPTEAEWEYACKAGKTEAANLDEVAVHANNNDGKYGKVGMRKPNTLGIYDMLGNVSEWTMDQYDATFYPTSPTANPWNKPTELYPRTTRGGSWKDAPEDCTCSERKPSNPNWKRRDPQFPKSLWWHTNAPFVGFRIIRPRRQPSASDIANYWIEAMDDFN